MTSSKVLPPEDEAFRITTSQQMASACCGALITSLACTPFDVVKIRLQAQGESFGGTSRRRCYVYSSGIMEHLCPYDTSKKEIRFKGSLDALTKIAKTEGFTSLWSGLSPTLVISVPATVVYFSMYENFKHRMQGLNEGVMLAWMPLVAGASARLCAVTLISPLELVRTKMQSKRLTYREMAVAVRTLVRLAGPQGLFKGLTSTLLRDVPFSALYWMSYEFFKKKLDLYNNPNLACSFMAGAVSGSIAATITTPFDVVKTRQQIELGEKVIFADQRGRPKTMRSVMRGIVREKGLGGLYLGLVPRLIKVAPACAIMITSFEYGKRFFQNYNREQYMNSQ